MKNPKKQGTAVANAADEFVVRTRYPDAQMMWCDELGWPDAAPISPAGYSVISRIAGCGDPCPLSTPQKTREEAWKVARQSRWVNKTSQGVVHEEAEEAEKASRCGVGERMDEATAVEKGVFAFRSRAGNMRHGMV